jgi:amidase
VAANLCALAVGTETDGSIICPSQTNGIVGIKPTLGLISRSGIIPIAHSQDTAGPMARSVADAAILLGVLAGVDGRDPATRSGQSHALKDYRPFLDENGLKGARIGVARKMAGTEPRTLKVFEACLDVMKQLGAVLIDPVEVPNFNKFAKTERAVLHYEFKADLNSYLVWHTPQTHVRTLADVIKFNDEHAQRVMPYFGQDLMIESEAKGPLTSQPYLRALHKNHLLTRQQGLRLVLEKHRLDAICVPTGGPAWMIDLVNGDAINWDMESTSMPAVAGYPHITVPAGYIFGLPVGLSFFSKAWQEPLLLKLAYAFEQASKVRKPPQFRASADLAWPG